MTVCGCGNLIGMTSYERSDLIYIMKMNRFSLSDSDTAHLDFSGHVNGKTYQVSILVIEDCPTILLKREGTVILNETLKSIDDLKIFLEERLYKYFEP